MTNTAQLALQSFEDAFKTTDWAAKTAAQKQTFVAQHYELKIDTAKEIEVNRIEAEQQAAVDKAAWKQRAITYLTNHGFACDNSLADWQKLYNRPQIFGANWNVQATYQKSISTGVDYFLRIAYDLWQQYVK